MKAKPHASKGGSSAAEQTVRDIRRATRKIYSAEEKIRLVLEGLIPALSNLVPAFFLGFGHGTQETDGAGTDIDLDIIRVRKDVGAWDTRLVAAHEFLLPVFLVEDGLLEKLLLLKSLFALNGLNHAGHGLLGMPVALERIEVHAAQDRLHGGKLDHLIAFTQGHGPICLLHDQVLYLKVLDRCRCALLFLFGSPFRVSRLPLPELMFFGWLAATHFVIGVLGVLLLAHDTTSISLRRASSTSSKV